MKPFKNLGGYSELMVVTIIISFLGALFITGVFVWQVVKNQDQAKFLQNQDDPENIYQLVSNYNGPTNCSYDNCLWQGSREDKEAVFGLATLKGWYATSTRMDWGEVLVDCDVFVVDEGPQPLLSYYKQKKHIFRELDQNNRVRLNIFIKNLSPEDKNQILDSNAGNPIELVLFQRPPLGKGATACGSDLEILRVRPQAWQKFESQELNLSFEHPKKFGEFKLIIEPGGEGGQKFNGTFSNFQFLKLGGISDDFSEGRGAWLFDTRGYYKSGDQYEYMWSSVKTNKKDLRPIKIISSGLGEVLLLDDQSFKEERDGMEGPGARVGAGNLAGLMNLDNQTFSGLIIHNTKVSEFSQAEFERMLASFASLK